MLSASRCQNSFSKPGRFIPVRSIDFPGHGCTVAPLKLQRIEYVPYWSKWIDFIAGNYDDATIWPTDFQVAISHLFCESDLVRSMVLTALLAAGAGVTGAGAGTYLTWNRHLGKT